jgi:hypothetical protein
MSDTVRYIISNVSSPNKSSYHIRRVYPSLYIPLLLQGYRPISLFRLQNNASSHLVMGRPIFSYPLGL